MEAVKEKEVENQALMFKTRLNSKRRRFILRRDEDYNYEKKYLYRELEDRLLRFSLDNYGTISDCFLLYAVAKLSVCDKETISLFLHALKKKNWNYQISCIDCADELEALKKRLTALYVNGFLFKHTYNADTYDYVNNVEEEDFTCIYTIDSHSQAFMNQKMMRSVPNNPWIQAKPIRELVGIASAAYVAARIANNDAFVDFKEGVFRCRSMGSVFLYNELKFKTDADYYVTCIPAFLFHDTRVLSKSEFEDWCIDKVNTMLQYIQYRERGNKAARIVMVVDNTEDLEKAAKLIIGTGLLDEYMDRVYFTGEGVMRHTNKLSECFVQLSDKREDMGFVYSYPDFLAN